MLMCSLLCIALACQSNSGPGAENCPRSIDRDVGLWPSQPFQWSEAESDAFSDFRSLYILTRAPLGYLFSSRPDEDPDFPLPDMGELSRPPLLHIPAP